MSQSIKFLAALFVGLGFGVAASAPTIREFPGQIFDGRQLRGEPRAIARGPDDRLWYTLPGWAVGAMTTDGRLNFPAVSSPLGQLSVEGALVTGPDGNVWLTDGQSRSIISISPQGALRRFSVRGQPLGIANGPHRNLWFTQPLDAAIGIGRISPD
jgi:streptogramin lyase